MNEHEHPKIAPISILNYKSRLSTDNTRRNVEAISRCRDWIQSQAVDQPGLRLAPSGLVHLPGAACMKSTTLCVIKLGALLEQRATFQRWKAFHGALDCIDDRPPT